VVTWGDGTTSLASVSGGTFTASHAYLDDTPSGTASDTFAVSVTISDDDLGTTTLAGRTVTVNNVAPTVLGFTVNGGTTATINENQTVTLNGSFTDPALGISTESFTVIVTWGDGSTSPATASGGNFTATHAYTDDNPTGTPSDTYIVSVAVSDDDLGTTVLGGHSVIVNNVNPSVTAGSATTLDAGQTLIRSGSFTDPGADTWTATIDYGDGSGVQPLALTPSKSFTLNHTYGQTGTFAVTVHVTDDDTGVGTASFQTTVNNVKPTLTVHGNQTVVAEKAFTLSPIATFTDANFSPNQTYAYAINWGDGTNIDNGTATITTPGSPGVFTQGLISGSHTFLREGTYTITVTITDKDGGTDTQTFAIHAAPPGLLAVANDTGGVPIVHVYNVDGTKRFDIKAYDFSFTGGVRVAVGDVDGDLTPDIITAAGPGAGPHVQVFSGIDGHQIRSFFAYEKTVTSGIWVAAGDIDGDGYSDIITGAGAGGGPHVQAFSGRDGSQLRSFFAYAPDFTGGVTVAAGDVDGDGYADIITGAGFGGGPHVQVFSGVDNHRMSSFFVYESTVRNGIFVAAGDLDGDGRVELVTGPGDGGGPAVRAFDPRTGQLKTSFFGFDPVSKTVPLVVSDAVWQSGLRVGVTHRFGMKGELMAIASGPGKSPDVRPEVRLYTLDGQLVQDILTDDPGFRGGVFVGGN
jgi:hypothetical protein